MGSRRTAREIALQILYQVEVNPVTPQEALELYWESVSLSEDVKEFAVKIVEGVHRSKEEIDRLIEEHSEHWKLDRMTWIDRNVLRMGVFELLHNDEIPPRVAINEAIDLGKRFGSEESGAFINGILDKIHKRELID